MFFFAVSRTTTKNLVLRLKLLTMMGGLFKRIFFIFYDARKTKDGGKISKEEFFLISSLRAKINILFESEIPF